MFSDYLTVMHNIWNEKYCQLSVRKTATLDENLWCNADGITDLMHEKSAELIKYTDVHCQLFLGKQI